MASKGFQNQNFHEDGNNVPDTASMPEEFSECCHQTIPEAFSGKSINQNATPYPMINNGTCSKEARTDLTSNAVINYIGQIMMEEDIDEDIIAYQEETALRKTEKSLYVLIGENYPPLPPLIETHTYQNDYTTKNNDISDVTQSGSETDGLSYSRSESLLTSTDPTSVLFMKNHLPATQIQKGGEDAMKFLPALGKLSVSLEPHRIRINVHEESSPNYVRESKAIGYETGTKRCALNDKEQYPSEGQAHKQQAVSSDEPAIDENLDRFLHSSFRDFVEDIITICESMKQKMDSKTSSQHQADRRNEMASGNKEPGEGLVDLISLLLRCSEAVSAADYSRAYELIYQIRRHSSPEGDCSQRMAHYLVDSLEARLVGTGSDFYNKLLSRHESAIDYLKAKRIYHAICPFMRASYFFCSQTILNVTRNARKVHIVDFGVEMGFMWSSFFERLSRLDGTPPKIRITGIDIPQKGLRPSKLVDETGRRLSEYAQRYNIRLKYQGIASKWESITKEDLKIENDEVLVVSSMYQLRRVADEMADMSCPRDIVLRLIREIKPRVFVHGILNGSYNRPFFTTRFKEVVSKLFSIFDILESNLPRDSDARLHLERHLISPKIMNAVACEGSERVERPETYKQWQARNLRAGFAQLPVDLMIKKKIRNFVRELYHKEFVVDEDKKWLLLGWKGAVLFGLSTWIPNDHVCKTY